MNYYNEFDPNAASWLRELIRAGLIADGVVDTRSITEVKPDELKQYTQCHFFAGIGGWSYALRLAGWSDDKPAWTGSCPCQPFSTAGKGKGTDDERHLWPVWFNLIKECHPDVIFGEQVEAAIGHGWLDLVCADLEREGYACGAVGLPACGVGAPHIRQRLWFVADAIDGAGQRSEPRAVERVVSKSLGEVHAGKLADTAGDRCSGERARGQAEERRQPQPGTDGQLSAGLERSGNSDRPDAPESIWRNADWLYCRDEKWRPVEPGLEPLVNGLSERVGRSSSVGVFKIEATPIGRVMRLRGYGNAIVPQVAAEVVKAYMEVVG